MTFYDQDCASAAQNIIRDALHSDSDSILDAIDNPEFQALRKESRELTEEHNQLLKAWNEYKRQTGRSTRELLENGDFHRLLDLSKAYLTKLEIIGNRSREIIREDAEQRCAAIREEAEQMIADAEARAKAFTQKTQKWGKVAKVCTVVAAAIGVIIAARR